MGGVSSPVSCLASIGARRSARAAVRSGARPFPSAATPGHTPSRPRFAGEPLASRRLLALVRIAPAVSPNTAAQRHLRRRTSRCAPRRSSSRCLPSLPADIAPGRCRIIARPCRFARPMTACRSCTPPDGWRRKNTALIVPWCSGPPLRLIRVDSFACRRPFLPAWRACRTGSVNVESFRVMRTPDGWRAEQAGPVLHGDRECVRTPPA